MDFQIERGVLTSYTGMSSDVIIPAGVKKIEAFAFNRNEKIRKVTIPEGVTEIDGFTFIECPNLEYVKMPDTVV